MRNQKKFVTFGICSIFLVMLSTFVRASAFSDLFGGGASAIFSQWQGGALNLNIAKILFFVIILVFVYAVIKFIPGVKKLNGFILFILAGAISFLATSYFTPNEVYTILMAYSGMGFALAVMIPFVILLGFTVQSVFDPPDTPMEYFMSKAFAAILWTLFTLFIVYRIFSGSDQSGGLYLIQIIMAGVSGIVAILCYTGTIFKWAGNQADKTTQELADRKVKMAARFVNTAATGEQELAGEGAS